MTSPKRLRILYAISGYGEEHLGYEMHRELAQEIIARGHEYSILALSRQRHMSGRPKAGIEDGIPVYRLVCSGKPYLDLINKLTTPIFQFPWFVPALWQIASFLSSHRNYDLIIAEGAYPFGAMIYLATRIVGMPFIVYVHGGDFIANQEANYGYGRFRLARWFMRKAFHAAKLVRAESLYGAEKAIELGCPPEKMALVQRNIGVCCYPPAGISLGAYRRDAAERIRQKYGINSRRLIVTVGRLLPIKGFDDLVRALPIIVQALGDTQILHLGPNRNDTVVGNYQKHLEQLASQLGVGDRIIYAGSVPYDQVRDFLAAADVVAVPSVQDSGNKLVMEAAAVGTPFVATRTSGNALWTPEWHCGLIVEPRAPDELAHALIDILSDPATGRRMGMNGLGFADEFSPDKVAERTIMLCQSALNGQPLPHDLVELASLLHPSLPPAVDLTIANAEQVRA